MNQGIKLYTIDSSKLIPIGNCGYMPGQEQAKIYQKAIVDTGLDYQADVSDGPLANQIFELAGIHNGRNLKVSATLFENQRAFLTLYYQNHSGIVCHNNISCYVEKESDYNISNAIIRLINNAMNAV